MPQLSLTLSLSFYPLCFPFPSANLNNAIVNRIQIFAWSTAALPLALLCILPPLCNAMQVSILIDAAPCLSPLPCVCELFGTDVSNFVVVVCSTEPFSYYEEDATTIPPPAPATYATPSTTRNSYTTRNYFNNHQFFHNINVNHIQSTTSPSITTTPPPPNASTLFNPFSVYLSSLPPIYATTTTTTPEPPHYDYHEDNQNVDNNPTPPPPAYDPYYHYYSSSSSSSTTTTEKPATRINPFYYGLYHNQPNQQQHTEYTTKSYHNNYYYALPTTTTTKTTTEFPITTRKHFYHNNYYLHQQQQQQDGGGGSSDTLSSSTRNPVFDVYLKRKGEATKNPYDFNNFGIFNKGTTATPRFAQNYFGANSQLSPVAAAAAVSNAGHIEQQHQG